MPALLASLLALLRNCFEDHFLDNSYILMKTNHQSLRIRPGSLQVLSICALILASLFAFGGCASTDEPTVQSQSNPAQKSGAPAAPAHSEVIILREGDVVKISFPDSANLDTTLPIRRDGKISLQEVGDVQAAGLTIGQLQDTLIKLYSPQIGQKNITVTLESSSFPVFVTGAVVRPGKVLSDHPMTALEAVMEAGGFDYATANTRAVKVIRNENGVMKHFTLNLQRMLDGQDSAPFYLQPDDIIYVSERFELF
jgi:polysaccharide export outer membrane protein